MSVRQRKSEWSAQKKYADILDHKMAFVEIGAGTPVVFLHGNPTSSYLWRNVVPHVTQTGRRLILPDLIGMGDSDKLRPQTEPDRYRFAGHARYLEAFLESVLEKDEKVTLVLHDWGGALGFDWAYRHQERIRAIAYMETFVRPLALADLPESFHPTLKAVRSDEGDRLVLAENMFIEQMPPGVIQRSLEPHEMDEYRRPFLEAGDARMPTLQWAREVPLSGDPRDVAERMEAYSRWLCKTTIPKLFINAEPGVFITGSVREFAAAFPSQETVTVPGLHFIQEDSPDMIGSALSEFLAKVEE